MSEDEDRYYTTADEPIDDELPPMTDAEIVNCVLAYKQEAEDARLERDALTDRNMDAYYGRHEAHEQAVAGQSREFLPKISQAADQMGGLVKRGLVAFGNYFSVDLVRPLPGQVQTPLDGPTIQKLLMHHLHPQQSPLGETPSFPTSIVDAVKIGLFQAVAALKVYGEYVPQRRLSLDTMGQLAVVETPKWQLRTKAIRSKDLYLDPAGGHLYLLEESECDWYEVYDQSQGEDPLYDPAVVWDLRTGAGGSADRDAELANETNQPNTWKGGYRHKVRLLECWGTILDTEGRVRYRNIVCTVANEHHLIRRPEANPLWHQRPPYVMTPLLRVPGSVWHKAVYDDAVMLQHALNELYNLGLDGAISAAWNTKEYNPHVIDNPQDFTDGIPPGATFLRKADAPVGVPALTVVQSGMVPPELMALFALTDREFQNASMTNDTTQGNIPRKKTTATEVMEASQNAGYYVESILFDLETQLIQPALWMAWLTVLQHADEWVAPEILNVIGEPAAQYLEQLSRTERYFLFGEVAKFKAAGLSVVVARARDFQKKMVLLETLAKTPWLAQEAQKMLSPTKFLEQIFRDLNMDIDQIRLTPEEAMQRQAEMYGQWLSGGMTPPPSGSPGEHGGSPAGKLSEPGGIPGMPGQVSGPNMPALPGRNGANGYGR